ncbi:hypothetical protein [Cohnella nanjingensis]|uniref:Uncharacterized protein n=1 Tax=Cohnella nanjingensis TaxID=1387779 RepID=A0A7X0RTU0_9BACL|nr:hypothetical protein [Cohnella nanjingensis]MBB6672270.1 hypothetical protein [Cohnella nanjingensis]
MITLKSILSIGSILTLIAAAIKLSPITLLTSTSLEKKLYSKERKFGYSILRFIVQVIGLALAMFLVNMVFFKRKEDFNGAVAIVGTIILLLVYCWIAWNKEINDRSLLQKHNYSKRTKLIMFITLLIFQAGFIIMPAYVCGTLFSYILFQKEMTIQAVLLTIAFLFAIYIIMAIFILPFMRTIWGYLDFKSVNPNYIEDRPFYIVMEKKRWYIHHLTDKNKILLGDAEQLKNCSSFKIVDRDNILKEEFHMVRANKASEIEYVI